MDPQLRQWERAFAGQEYFYGEEPGPVARRAVRYHRRFLPEGGTALDAGCGEGQDLLFLAQRGYAATGVEFTPSGAAKSRRLLREHDCSGEVLELDLRQLDDDPRLRDARFDLVLAVNSLQFMGEDAPAALAALRERVRPGGVIGLSLFAREGASRLAYGCWLFTLEEVMGCFPGWQPLEAAQLWQWSPQTVAQLNDAPQAFVTLLARRPA